MTFRRFADSTRAELRPRTGDLLVIPLGSTEQHGDQLPVCTDSAVIAAIADRACALAGAEAGVDVLLAPVLTVGVSGHHLPFGGTISVHATGYLTLLGDLVRGLWAQGFTRILLLNGHGGNDAPMRVAVESLSLERGADHRLVGLSYWDLAPQLDGIPVPGHAGRFETSLMLALHPELVEKTPADTAIRALGRPGVAGLHDARRAEWSASDGITDGAAESTAAEGERLLGRIVDAVAEVLVELADGRPA